jgi:GNAT superfamily N-acetyltransferase
MMPTGVRVEEFRPPSGLLGEFESVHAAAGHLAPDEPLGENARGVVAFRGFRPVARMSLAFAHDLHGAPGRTGLVGHYEAVDREVGTALLGRGLRTLRRDGARRVLGPINGSTWGRYRLVVDGDLGIDPPFLSEPENPPEYVDDFREAGFRVVAEYESAVVEDLAAADPRAPEYSARLATQGATMRTLDLDRFDEELDAVHRLSVEAFAQNRYYAPISLDAFRARYLPMRPFVDPDLVRLAVGADGALLGFVFAFPDLLSAHGGRPTRVVLKTLATAPAARGLGLGSLLTDEVRRIAREKGYRAVIHALMEAGNPSVRISRHSARVMRRYALFGWEP